MNDRFHLARFVDAQSGVYDQALAELRAGRKRTHWMWFVFPQIAGLGSSPTAQFYAIESIEEARAYAEHPLLGSRLRECTRVLLGVSGRSANEIFGSPDNLKFRSCMTLFTEAAPNEPLFGAALAMYFEGKRDEVTTRLLAASPDARG